MADILQMSFWNAFSWIKNCVSWFKFQWDLFQGIQLSICQEWLVGILYQTGAKPLAESVIYQLFDVWLHHRHQWVKSLKCFDITWMISREWSHCIIENESVKIIKAKELYQLIRQLINQSISTHIVVFHWWHSWLTHFGHMASWLLVNAGSGNGCCLFSAKTLPESVLTYCQFNPQQQTSVKFKLEYQNYHSTKCIWKCCLQNGGHFVQASMC